MNRKQKGSRNKDQEKLVSRARHENYCKVCLHPQKEAIEQEWIDWGNTSRIAEDYRIGRDSIYRHAHALGLFAKRERNIRKALERMIEKAESVEVNASAVVSAIQAYSKINAMGRWVERVEGISLNELFDRMSQQELEVYAHDGVLPDWFGGATALEDSSTDEER